MATPKQKTRVRREQIARAALGLIAREGPSALSVTAVAREVGLTPSALYRHYEGRDQIVSAAYSLVGQAMRENLRTIEREDGPPLTRLRHLLDRHVSLLMKNPGIPRLVFSEQTYGDPARSRDTYAAVRSYLSIVASLLAQAQKAGEISAEVDPAAAATLFLGIIQPQAVLWQMSGEAFDLRATTERAWELLLRGLLATDVPTHFHDETNRTRDPEGE